MGSRARFRSVSRGTGDAAGLLIPVCWRGISILASSSASSRDGPPRLAMVKHVLGTGKRPRLPAPKRNRDCRALRRRKQSPSAGRSRDLARGRDGLVDGVRVAPHRKAHLR